MQGADTSSELVVQQLGGGSWTPQVKSWATHGRRIVWHARGAEADERTCERMRGGGGGDVSAVLCTILGSDEKGK